MMRGLTLIEVLVYMTLLSLLLVGTHTISSAIATAAQRTHVETQILSEGIFISNLIKNSAAQSPVAHIEHDSLVLSDGRIFRQTDGVLWYEYGNTGQQLSYLPITVSVFENLLVSSTTAPSYVEVVFTLSAYGIERSFTSLLYL